MRVYGATNEGALEIATGDDGTEPIYVRQYKNAKVTGDTYSQYYSGTPKRTLTLLDGNGNTSIPQALSVGGNLTENGSITNSKITDLENRLAALESNSISINSLTNAMISSVRDAVGEINYREEAAKYINHLAFLDSEIWIDMKGNPYPTMKYLVFYFKLDWCRYGFILIYDFVKQSGSASVINKEGSVDAVAQVGLTQEVSGGRMAIKGYFSIEYDDPMYWDDPINSGTDQVK